jgi:hypothetical protein
MTAPVEPTTEPKPTADPPAGDPPKPTATDDKPLGPGGEAALKAEREKAKNLEKELAKFRKAEADRADADKTEAEKRAAAEQRATDAEARAMRLEVASEKGLTAAQAKRLIGSTREELEADADELLTTFTPASTATPALKTAPKPDPSQGPKAPGAPQRPTSLSQAVSNTLANAKG